MKKFSEFLKDEKQYDEQQKMLCELTLALEHQTHKNIPGTKNSYRIDPQNTSTMTQRHAHVYAKMNGKGSQLYSVNLDGSGHDGNSGVAIPSSHASYFKGIGFSIPDDLTLESIGIARLDPETYTLCILSD